MKIHRTYPAHYVDGVHEGKSTTEVAIPNPAILEREEVEQLGEYMLEFASAVDVEWQAAHGDQVVWNEGQDHLEEQGILLV